MERGTISVVDNIVVGWPATSPAAPAHTPGVREGNRPPHGRREPGIRADPRGFRVTARRSTGIRAKAHGPIDPAMPVISPP
jgi:hypothetical protein